MSNKSNISPFDKFDPTVFTDPLHGIDPDTLAPNRTAKSAEEMVTILSRIEQSSEDESKKNKTRFIITASLAAIAAVASVVALFHPF